MKSPSTLLLVGALLLGIGALPAAEPSRAEQVVAGSGSYGAVNIETLDGSGQIKLNGTSVAHLQLIGSLIANQAQIGSLQVSGDANLSDSQVKKQMDVVGYLRAQRTTFEQPISLSVQRAVFTASKLQAVTVCQNMGFKGKQVLELRQGTIIHGPVVFEGGKGEILLYSGSKVLGEVTGGKVLVQK